MKNRKIDLENIKVAIFDFDDTLAIHQDKDFLLNIEQQVQQIFKIIISMRI